MNTEDSPWTFFAPRVFPFVWEGTLFLFFLYIFLFSLYGKKGV